MALVGKAYIEVRADVSKFPAELRTKLKGAIKDGLNGVEFDGLADKAEKAGREAGEKLGKGFENSSRNRLKKSGEEGGKSLLSGLTSIFKKGTSSSESGGLFSAISGMFSGIATTVATGFSQLSQLGGQISSLSNGLGAVGGGVAQIAQIGAFAVLIPIILGLAGALIQLSAALLALPAAGGVALAILAPLLIAFQGVGEAIGAGFSGDVDKFNESLKGLAPNARSVVREFVGLKPLLDGVKKSVQGAFFGPLIGSVKRFGTAVLPTVTSGLVQISAALGNVAAQLLAVFSRPESVAAFSAIMTTAANVVNQLGPALTSLAAGLLATFVPALPFVQKFMFLLIDGLNMLGRWLGTISSDGRLTSWLQRAADIGQSLWDVLKGLGVYLFKVLSSFGDEGASFLDGLADGVQKLIAFLDTDEGQEYLENLGFLVKTAGEAFLWLLSIVPTVLSGISSIITFFRQIDDVLAAFWGWLTSTGAAIGAWFSAAGTAIADFFTKDIPRYFGMAVDWFASLPGMIWTALGDLGALLVEWISSAFTWLVQAALFNIGVFIAIIWSLPGLILAGLAALPELLGSLFDRAWAWVKDVTGRGIDAVTAFVDALPGRVLGALSSFRTMVSAKIGEGIAAAENFVHDGVDRIVGFMASLPGRVAALGPAMRSAAMGLGRAIGEGLSQIGNFASDIGGKIVATIKSGVNAIVSGINNGIASIDDILPGSLPRLPHFARGGIIDSPTLGVMGEGGKREVVLPLTDPKRTMELANESGLLDILGRAGGGAPVVNVTAIIDGYGLVKIVDTRVETALQDQGAELAFGART